MRAYHLKSFLARHATRKITAVALTCRRRSKGTYLKRSGETLKGAKRQGAHRTPRGKRSNLERKSTTFKSNRVCENNFSNCLFSIK
ncbi:hypothetical protein P8610_07870 [Fictibacillus sp. UD]